MDTTLACTTIRTEGICQVHAANAELPNAPLDGRKQDCRHARDTNVEKPTGTERIDGPPLKSHKTFAADHILPNK